MPKATGTKKTAKSISTIKSGSEGISEGRTRVVITNVQPQVDGGQYAARTVVDEPVVLSADIFADGHDELNAVVKIRHEKERKWRELPLKLLVNDRWECLFIPDKMGRYTFTVEAWIDHFATWQKGLKKKYDADVDIETDLLIGADLLDETANQTTAGIKKSLTAKSKILRSSDHTEHRYQTAVDQDLSELVNAAGVRQFSATFSQTLTLEVAQRKALFSTWYELFPRSAAPEPGRHGTFRDVERLLPRISEMGFDTLYFPPIHPIGEKKRKGRNNALSAEESDPGSPWAIGSQFGGHKAIHPELGTLDDFKHLLAEAKKYGIDIALDIAFQCAPDHPYVKEHPQWFRWRPDGTVQYAENPPKKYEDILPINFETADWENLWQELKSVVEYWIEQGVRIFRVDNPHTKSFRFWEWMIAAVKKHTPDVIFLAEAFTRPRSMEHLAKIGFTQSYTYFTWRQSAYELQQYMTELTQSSMKYYFKPNFWPNTPDILPPHLTEGGENAHVIRVILAATLSSNYGIYGPVYEFGMNTPHPEKEEYIDNEKYEIKFWDWERKTRIRDVITRLNQIRNAHPALQSTFNIQFAETTNPQILAYIKQDPVSNNTLLVVVNLDPHHSQSGFVKVPVEQIGLKWQTPYWVDDLLADGKYQWQDDSNFVILHPNEMPAHLFKIEQESN